MTSTDPPKTINPTPNMNPGQIGGYESTAPTMLDNIAKNVDPSPKEAEHEMKNPADS